MRRLLNTITTLLILLPCIALAAGDKDKGKILADSVCAACHGPDGNSPAAMYPKLAGQHVGYLEQSLKEFRKGPQGKRNDPVMYGMAVNLSDEDIANVAAYFASQTMSSGGALKDLVAEGERLYRGGNPETGVPACLACHGPQGKGNTLANYPVIAGQHAEYIAAELKAYRNEERVDDPNGMMRGVAKRMTDAEITAVSSYIAGLH